jgi:phosphatidylserine/phosphatidylglycerophosphate/cardiolipin synthase-like enzyme
MGSLRPAAGSTGQTKILARVDIAGEHPRKPTDQPMPMNIDALPSWAKIPRVEIGQGAVHILTSDTWAPAYCAAIDGARTSIMLCQYSLSTRWDASTANSYNVWAKLLAAKSRGLECRALLARHKRTAATANFNERSSAKLSAEGWTVRRAGASRLLHAKLTIFDDDTVIIGSHNLTEQASSSNVDISVMITGHRVADRFTDFVQNLWAKYG